LNLGDKIHLTNIVFDNSSINVKVDSVAKYLSPKERIKLYKYLSDQFDNFSIDTKKLNAQPVRLIYIKIPDDRYVYIGIDIYGSHFLWTIDKVNYWKVIKVKKLWDY